MAVPAVYLVCGATGAGKSTYSENLAQSLGGVRFSIDEWLQRLHNADQPETMQFSWFYERVQRNCAQMREIANRLVELGTPVIFDCGFTNKKERDTFADWAEARGFPLALHLLDVPQATRWQRTQKRNHDKAETFQFEVTRDMFDFIENLWEAPDQAEMAALNGQRISP